MVTNALLQRDRYEGFDVRYDAFRLMHMIPVRIENVDEVGRDVTSCLYRRRKELIKILAAAGEPAKFRDFDVRLKIVNNGETWYVNEWGGVRHGKKDTKLSPKALLNLKQMVFESLPGTNPTIFNPPLEDR